VVQHCNPSESRKECSVSQQIQQVRPVRVAAQRQRELMAIIAQGEDEIVEWLDEEYVDMTGLSLPIDNPTSQLPVITVQEHLCAIWEDEVRSTKYYVYVCYSYE